MVSLKASETPFPQAKTLRVRFQKRGNMQYISHLDLVRTMTRVIVRTGLPVYYSEGFNPIPRFSFAAPLSIGVESAVEIMDIRVTHPVDLPAVKEAFNRALPEALSVYDVYMAETKVTDIAYADYEIRLHTAYTESLLADIEGVLSSSPLTVVKNTKNGEKETDISPVIKRVTVKGEGKKILLSLSLACQNAAFLNPEYVLTALRKRVPVLQGKNDYYTVLRTGLCMGDGTPFR